MAPTYNLNHVTRDYPFMTCLVKVDTQSTNWQKTVAKVLNKCHGVYSFKMDGIGIVELSGTVDPNLLLKMLGKAGRKAELRWFQFGECSSNLFRTTNHGQSYNHNHGYRLGYDYNHDHQQDYSYPNHGYPRSYDDHRYDYDHWNCYEQGGTQPEFRYDRRSDHRAGHRGEDMACCRVM